MTRETKKWWEETSAWYQSLCKIPVDVHYGPGSPNEDKLELIGNVKGKRVLEIGCGGAQCSIAFAKQGAKVSAIDISEEQLKFAKALAAKNRVKINFYQGDIKSLRQIRSGSQDVVFSAFALLYVDDLPACFREVKRVLKKNGVFVFSVDHPFHKIVDSKKLKLKGSYFKTGKFVDEGARKDGSKYRFVMYCHTVGGIYNALKAAGFDVEAILEPDSRKRHAKDPWYGLWDYPPRLLKLVPPTIIFKCKPERR